MPNRGHGFAGDAEYAVTLRSAEFAGPVCATVPLAEYAAAIPDPLWREAPAALRHLEDRHVAELTACVRAHGLLAAETALPQALDRFGLQLVVLAPTGTAVVRLAFPDGPVTALHEVPGSIRAMLTCRCAGMPPLIGR